MSFVDATPGADDLGLDLLPPDDDPVTPEQDLAAAVTAALEDPLDPQEIAEDAPEPFGRSWRFDMDTGRFVRAGISPAAVTGPDALIEWATVALHTARFAHPIYSEQFGVEEPNAGIGDAIGDETEADFPARARDALLVHDRITDVEITDVVLDPMTGVLVIGTFRIFTDEEEEELTLDGLTIRTDLEG